MRKSERGFSLIVLLTLLAAVGGVALVEATSRLNSSRSLRNALVMNAELVEGRQALLSYTTFYPYLYGPKGAGLGHFPCPDTNSLQSNTVAWSSNQGPNPPCGGSSGREVSGYLPRHISFPSGRYMIHAGLRSRVHYTASAKVINNPGNYPVNPSLTSRWKDRWGKESPHPALLAYSTVGAIQQNKFYSEVPLTRDSLLLSIRPSIAAWLVEKLNQQETTPCIFHNTERTSKAVLDESMKCQQISELLQHCTSSGLPVSLSHELKSTEDRYWQNSSDNSDINKHWQDSSNNYQIKMLLLYLADSLPVKLLCDQQLDKQIFIDVVPAKQHWFVRNGWSDWIKFERDLQCIQLQAVSCRPVFVQSPSRNAFEEPVVLRWVADI